MQDRQINKPIKLLLDASLKYLPPDSGFFLLNHERNILGTGTLGKSTPMAANYEACSMNDMDGTPYAIGAYYDENTNELYAWTYNDGGVNYILRLNPDTTCEVVYAGECLPLSAEPKHSIEQWKAYLKYDKLCAHRHGKQLIWTDGENEIGMLDVEASIATNGFTTPFFDICPDECAPLQMCVPSYCGLLEGEFIPLEAGDIDLSNKLLDVAVQVMFRFHYYDQRVGEWEGISTLFYQDSRNCFDDTEGFPRCIKFRMPVGNPLVEKIEIAVRTNNELGTDGLSPQWYSYELIEKYEPYSSQSQYWYERDLADLLNFSESDCAFDYIFCNDKECNPISTAETRRVYNPIPRQPQGLLPIKNSLGFYNYKKGTCPIDGTEAEKFEIGLECASVCNAELVDVTFYVINHNMTDNRNGFVYRSGGNAADAEDDLTDKARFGRGNLTNDTYGTEFKDKTRNFIAYIEGTDYWTELVQWKATPNFTSSMEYGIVSGMDDLVINSTVRLEIENGNFFVQKGVIKVPKGTRGFIRIASQKATNGLDDNQDSSTYVLGTITDIHNYTGTTDLAAAIERNYQELYFDTCAGSTELNETLIIDDQYKDFTTGNHSSSAYSGYITDNNNQPVPSAEIWYNGSIKALTDYNGFYHFYLYGGVAGDISVQVRVEQSCVGGFTTVKTVTITGGYSLTEIDFKITNTDAPNYATDFYEIFVVVVKDCNNVGVGGVRVALFGQKYVVTDAVSGTATFKVRNYSTRDKMVRAVVINQNGCFTLNCAGGCNPCNPVTANTLLSACFSGTPYLAVVPDNLLNTASSTDNQKGLKAGGRYPFGFVVKWPCGQISPVYPATILTGSLPQSDNYLNVPKTQEKNILSFCNFTFRGNGITLPIGASCLSIVRGANVNPFELQWVVDDFERTSDGKIRITIQSLNDYNATYNFQTNTVYQYLKGDRVEFISNGDGNIFDTATYGLLNYQILSPFHDKIISGEDEPPADFFNQILIDDDGSLADLVKGAKIELQRPKECTVQPTYFEIYTIPIDANGHLVTSSGTFLTFDTFFINRKIGTSAAQIFEHHSPSDHWGNRLSDAGKAFFVNPFENEKRFGLNITINSETRFNVFGYLEKTIEGINKGDITFMGLIGKRGVILYENGNALFQISDEFLRIGSDGLVRASAPDQVVSDAILQLSITYGCQYNHTGSIIQGDGWIMYWDVNKGAYCKHDFNIARDISENKARLYFVKRGQFIETFNSTAATDIEKFRPITGYNIHTGAVQLTVKALNQGGINNEAAMFAATNDTILFDPKTEDFLTTASYTAERYSNINLFDDNGCAFVSFLNGIPYIHPKIPIDYNEFFGTAVDWIIGIALNQNPDKIKVPVSIEEQSEDMFFVTKVITDKVGFESEIPSVRFKQTERKWNASFLFDKNSRGGLYGNDTRVAGTQARGYYIAITFIRDNTTNLIYNSVNPTKMIKFGELDMLLLKYSYSEQSGFTGNV